MGKFNWRGAAQGALGSLYNDLQANREQKRAYERQDREAAQQLYAQMIGAGMTPEEIGDPGDMGEISKQLLGKWSTYLPKKKLKEAQEEERKLRLELSTKAEFASKEPSEFKSSIMKTAEDLYGLTPKDFREMTPAAQNKILERARQINEDPYTKALTDQMKLMNLGNAGLQQSISEMRLDKLKDEKSGNRPLTTPENESFGTAAGTTLNDVKGKKPLAPAERQKLNAVKNMRTLIKEGYDLSIGSGLIGAESAIGTIPQRIMVGTGAATGLDQKAKMYEDYINTKLPTLSKFAGDVGNFALQEQLKQRPAFPMSNDTKNTGTNKLLRLWATVDKMESDMTGEPLEEVKKKYADINPFKKQGATKDPSQMTDEELIRAVNKKKMEGK